MSETATTDAVASAVTSVVMMFYGVASSVLATPRDLISLAVVAVAVAALVAWLLLSDRVNVRQRTLWTAFVLVILTATVGFDAIEVRFEEGTHAVYWRSDWDWDSGGGGLTEWSAATAMFVGASVAAALAYSAVVGAASRRLRKTSARILLYVLSTPPGLLLAYGLIIAMYAHPLLFYSERYS